MVDSNLDVRIQTLLTMKGVVYGHLIVDGKLEACTISSGCVSDTGDTFFIDGYVSPETENSHFGCYTMCVHFTCSFTFLL